MNTGLAVVGGAGAIGVITAMWGKIKVLFSKVAGLFIVSIELRGYTLDQAVRMMLVTEFKTSPIGHKVFNGSNEYVRPLQKNQLVVMETIPNEATMWWRNWRPLFVSYDGNLKISFMRGVYKKDKFILEAVSKFNDGKNSENWKRMDRFFVRRKFGSIGKSQSPRSSKEDGEVDVVASESCDKRTTRPMGWTRDELGQPKKKSAMDDLSLSKDILAAFDESILWRNSENWFKKKGVPWKRGWLLHGKPGTGKTAFVRALGQELNMPIFLFDIATMSNQDFIEEWENVKNNTPCIVLFEDIDAVFDGRENIAVKDSMEIGLTFECFLNSIDGVENSDGLFVVVTTNNIEKLDPAIGSSGNGEGMSSRPGRIDKAIKFPRLDDEGRLKMTNRILKDFERSKWEHILIEGVKDTGAQFQLRCCNLALKFFWEKNIPKNK